jgi:penicillin-binding protein 1C
MKKKYLLILILTAFCAWLLLPGPAFDVPRSTVIYDRNGELIAAQIADDGQWRFPAPDSIPEKFKKCIINFEDQYFYYHPGINPVSYWKALLQNIRAGRIVRGGSTITLQVIRLAGKRKRTVISKLVESILAVKLEIIKSKGEILKMYVANAPFGSNVVGLEAASWRYYGRPPYLLSWGEAASLAVLPNAPGLVYPGRNHDIYVSKRNRLLEKLMHKGIIDTLTCSLAKDEPVPGEPLPLPSLSCHLLAKAADDGLKGQIVRTTVDRRIQENAARILQSHHIVLSANKIENAALIVLEVETGNVLAYIGNVDEKSGNSSGYVDIIRAERSSGSILKPFLYASAISEGMIMPDALLPDIPTLIAGYAPVNYEDKYDGAVRAGNALARSLNIPAVRLLQQYKVARFHHKLQELGFTTIDRSPDNYGLSLILGGAEVNLWELSGAYANMARMLLHYRANSSMYDPGDYHMPVYIQGTQRKKSVLSDYDILGAAPVWHILEALTAMDRPLEGLNWEKYSSSRRVAWKTGTSFGNRDAWAVGVTPGYVVAVWAGNADGEGRPGLTGVSAAAPVMFDVINSLPYSGWFEEPYDDMTRMAVCRKSGYKASPACDVVDTLWVAKSGLNTLPCPYHRVIQLDKTGKYRVTSECYPVSEMTSESWFVLPAVMEWYYRSGDPYYMQLPPFMSPCVNSGGDDIALIYPESSSTMLFIPRDLKGSVQKVVFEAAHRRSDAIIYWNLDEIFIKTTNRIHQAEIYAEPGHHVLTLVDDMGERLVYRFTVTSR